MAKRKSSETTKTQEQESQVVFGPEPKPEPKPKASFRGAGFEKFRAEHQPRWSQKAQATVHDNEDEMAEQLAYEIREFGWWSAPLVIKHLGHKIAELQARYATLNAGMIRMNLGNQIRASIRREAKAATK